MSTDGNNGAATGSPAGVWMTVSELARVRGVDKGGLSRRVAGFGEAVTTKPGPRGSKLVNVVEFDRACGEIGDTLRMVVPKDEPADDELGGAPSSSARLTDNRALIAQYDAENKFLDLEERKGRLVAADEVHAAVSKAADKIVARIDQLYTRSDDCAAAVARDGAAGARAFLKMLADELLEAVAKDFNPDTVAVITPARDG